jgi:hypothetical protein
LDRLGRHAEALRHWERALQLDDGKDRRVLRLGRSISRAHLGGDHGQALAEAEALAGDADGPALEGMARLCALASAAVAGDLREPYAARAVALLRQAVAKGYQDIVYLKEGTDLAALRERPDFQKLLVDREAKRATPGK